MDGFDTVRRKPAEVDGRVLIGLSNEDAGLALYRPDVGLIQSRVSTGIHGKKRSLEGEAGIIDSNEM